jgi:predicted 3-demethylubiquinone-9 3-methyltransferase (glyoxalase superfamily)
MIKPAKNTICLWYNGDAEDAARFYAKTFPDSSVGAVFRAPGDFPSGKKGDVLTVCVYRDGHPLSRAKRRPRVQAQRSILFSGHNR